MLKDSPVSAILPAEDIERAKKFYTEILDLQSVDTSFPGTASFKCGDGTMLYLYEREGGTKADHTVAGWVVDDVEKAVDMLSERGLEFEQYDLPGLKTDERGIAESNGMKGSWFKDSEGNILSFTELPK
ncbi:MAG: VOC family protein [Anaerolineales bacterium]|jgi:catechol 2,3-dioxygenase-like lactoylglutathione lyase family enzyme